MAVGWQWLSGPRHGSLPSVPTCFSKASFSKGALLYLQRGRRILCLYCARGRACQQDEVTVFRSPIRDVPAFPLCHVLLVRGKSPDRSTLRGERRGAEITRSHLIHTTHVNDLTAKADAHSDTFPDDNPGKTYLRVLMSVISSGFAELFELASPPSMPPRTPEQLALHVTPVL